MLVGYCIRRSGEPGPPPGLCGVAGHPVRVLEEGPLALWLSEGTPEPPSLVRIREHDDVVRAALRTATPLPLRFATRFADEAAAGIALRERADHFLASLERVAGRVEVAIRIVHLQRARAQAPPEAPASPIRSGRDFLMARRAELERASRVRADAEQVVAEVERRFASLELATVHALTPEPGVLATVAHLVHREELRDYRLCLQQARSALPELELRLTGPWAPYSFV